MSRTTVDLAAARRTLRALTPRTVALSRFRDGTGSIDPSEHGSVDCRLSGDPVAWLLALYGRVGWEELLRAGRVTVTDGDATLGAGFKRLLRNP